ncbi:MAG TPA: M1 family metallopeptidase [Flavisolibacter sp.]|nr:M1 family metallopeptidase [Flavisolibacter sp.]
MKFIVLLTVFFLSTIAGFSQKSKLPEAPRVYQATPERINDLVHTKLDAGFDYQKQQLNGKAWITLKPHFYPTDSLMLDAKGMDIKEVAVVKGGKNTPLKHKYDGLFLNINLDKTYRHTETYTVYISYTAKPNEFKSKGSAAITDAKGLYFINPLGEDKEKPTQIWTQGETEATSVWIPTIDRPAQKTTQEFYLTVPAKYVSLSNGKLVSQKANAGGTRTDYWKMDLPHAPYLFFIGVGDYAVVKDSYKGKEVSYYVEKEYAPVARRIFGKTPAMMALFSRLTGVEYPWVKYAQMVARDYVSGAMENTTATLHGETAQQDARELTEKNRWEEVIAHELFHQWFGDYVTSESWSNLTVNESFATLGSQLWNEYQYGKDAGDEERYTSARGYLGSGSEKKDLVRFTYNDKEDMFDAVSYNKGGAVLQMLRKFVGDSAFFKSLNVYLTANKFKAAEVHNLRLAFEEVTGKDMNWFFNQWYFSSGHPKLNIAYSYDATAKQAVAIVTQQQEGDKLFTLPVAVDVWAGSTPTRHNVWVKNKVDTFYFPASVKPSLINFDADKILLADRTENKSLDDYAFQYSHAGNYVDRREAIDAAVKKQAEVGGVQIMLAAIKDKYAPLRTHAINSLDMSLTQVKNAVEVPLAEAAKDADKLVKAAAINKLGQYKFAKYAPLFKAAINDSSYSVAGNALDALNKVDTTAAFTAAKELSAGNTKGRLEAATKTIMSTRDKGAALKVLTDYEAMPLGQPKFQALGGVFELVAATGDLEIFKRGVDDILALGAAIPENFREQAMGQIYAGLREIQKAKKEDGLAEQVAYLDSKLPKDAKGSL